METYVFVIGSEKDLERRVATDIERTSLMSGKRQCKGYRENTPGDRGEMMKATTHYPMMILFFVSLLIGQFGCAHMPQHPYQQTWVCSADGPEFDTPCIKGKIFEKLQGGIALVFIQMNKGQQFGWGGQKTVDKARLYFTLDDNKVTIIKGKNWAP